MSQKINKNDLKSPDIVQAELRKGFQWTTSHSQMVLGLSAVVLLAWGGWLAMDHFAQAKETTAQAEFFKIEKKYLEKKDKFSQSLNEEMKKDLANKKAKNDAKNTVETKSSAEGPTGDLAKDYGSEIEDFSQLISKNPSTKAAQMAGLHLAQIQVEYGQFAQAEDSLKKVLSNKSTLLSALVMKQLGVVQSNLNNCQGALESWSKVLANAEGKSFYADIKLNMGLCYESLKDFSNAEKMYADVKSVDANSPISKSAEKYLKLLETVKK